VLVPARRSGPTQSLSWVVPGATVYPLVGASTAVAFVLPVWGIACDGEAPPGPSMGNMGGQGARLDA
jgi:hypothetical protein